MLSLGIPQTQLFHSKLLVGKTSDLPISSALGLEFKLD